MGGKGRSILLVVEGVSDEPKLVQSLFECLVPDADRVVHPYGTNIHDLIEKITSEYGGDYEDIEICRVLADMLPADDEKNRQLLLYTKFTDVILMFDFDPQDDRFNLLELRKMLVAFRDSTDTDKGLLLLNYPAVEAVKVAAALTYEEYVEEKYDCTAGASYKEYANSVVANAGGGSLFDFSCYNVKMLVRAIGQTVGKAQHLVQGMSLERTFPMRRDGQASASEACLSIDQVAVLDYESTLFLSSGTVATLSMGPFFVASWGRGLDGAWKSCFGE
ncbi:MAG: hypothetical protein IKG11_08330 [Atopobiaceae bacterium]|nr:hypothetical protein [Atopobiaceae bacterium]